MSQKTRGISLRLSGMLLALALAGCASMEKPLILNSDLGFAFGSAELTPEGKEQIRQYADSLLTRGEIRIDVIGHPDRIGDPKANQILSQRRAEAVRNELALTKLNADRITARGVGAVNPLVECHDRNQAALIACLAPNRRVEIKVSDTRW